ncbi:aspartate--tRNA ligase [bacterium]|jgi:aspartyl-tRNA synthetase|nr:aspartate--tRNA ligase [bacterium]MBT4121759.1 aspartate--tRNA ligase [bacterium]MBT4334878.1 aspartate--tRNA ligase [bacterium]MBT4495171.1 aspartate--tRNA ligase [bacterium]MBT4763966.1 aspartate--tRNA ligase [bacterium]
MKVNNVETINKVGEKVLLKGWVNSIRKMGKIVFIDLRDKSGLLQIVLVPQEMDKASVELMSNIKPEYVLAIEGEVQARGDKQINKDLATGTVEILGKSLKILSESLTPPFEIDNEERQANEELRLKYRYLDLRHERMKNNLIKRHKVIQFCRNYLSDRDFTEVQTPVLTKSSPEGARDYLVPSRVHKGKFFALPQAPQQYKQLLMVAGLERYYQVAPCFRDEDARADRSPGEFYQLDMEMSFTDQNELLELVEEMFTAMIKEIFPEKKMVTPWPRITHEEAMSKYKSDKPDLRKNKEDKDELAFAWIIDFPLFTDQTKEDEEFVGAKGKWAPSHNMFTRPKEEDLKYLDKDPSKVKAYQHDLVLNGFEVGGGALRIYDAKVQEKVFDLIGFDKKQKEYFKHLLEAFSYGVPPHGGIAPGIDRLLATILGEKSIKEVIAFPLTSDARDPLMGAPAEVTKEQLKELGIKK